MPRVAGSSTPKYRRHKPSGQAVVTIAGQDHYLGPWQSKTSHIEHDRLIAEWLAAGRPTSKPVENDLTIMELLARYKQFAKSYYAKDGKVTGTFSYIEVAIDLVKTSYGRTKATDFGPLALKALRQKLIDDNRARSYINKLIDCVRRIFKWGVAEELLPPAVYQALQAVSGLRKGRGDARETQPVKPVDDATVEATLPFLPTVVADMVRFQHRLPSRRSLYLTAVRRRHLAGRLELPPRVAQD